ncbi:MAG TPA: hypothetical protein VNA26_04065 [Chitinophagaceae bacterium]|nr:hypothetical protein [Chitinophagaceae bacterium]
MKKTFLFCLLSFLFFGCFDGEAEEEKIVDPERIYFDYKITGSEDNEFITVLLQYRSGGSQGISLPMNGQGKIEFDENTLVADNAPMSGAFYETQIPQQDFAGKHTINFTNTNGKSYKEEFEFVPLRLITEIPDTIIRNDIALQFEGLKDTALLRLILIDTAFYSDDINEIDTVKRGQLIIAMDRLKKLKSGPISMEIIKEEERPIKNRTKAGGMLTVSYGLKREFELRD